MYDVVTIKEVFKKVELINQQNEGLAVLVDRLVKAKFECTTASKDLPVDINYDIDQLLIHTGKAITGNKRRLATLMALEIRADKPDLIPPTKKKVPTGNQGGTG